MQILGTLVELPEDPTSLPLPWWHRSPLGLLDTTPVFVALVETEKRPVGDLIVSVLDPVKWPDMIQVRCQGEDQPGFIGRVFESVFPLNIAIAETATLETGNRHDIALICEPFGQANAQEGASIEAALKERGISDLSVSRFLHSIPSIRWHNTDSVHHGWLRRTEWRQHLIETYPGTVDDVDLSRAVVSADTEKRILRFVFPRRGAKTVRIEHADRPGALRAISHVFAEAGINVLSALLRRGGARHSRALLIAICEPEHKNGNNDMAEKLNTALKSMPKEFSPIWNIRDATPAHRFIYPRHPEEIVARIPSYLRPTVREYKQRIPREKTPVFISRRFIGGSRRDRIVARVRKILEEHGCYAVEATPEPGDLRASFIEVSARMWVAEAGIVLVAGGIDKPFSMNLAHEAGFLSGQGKPVLVLVEQGSDQSMTEWSNAHGIVAPRFPADDSAFDPDSPESLDRILESWINTALNGTSAWLPPLL